MILESLLGNRPFTNQLAVVSGAASGIGRCVALRLASLGATVVAVDRETSGLQSLTKEANCANVHSYACDVSDAAAVTYTVSAIHARYGVPDYLVNVAGTLRPGSATDLPLADWEATFRVNSTGVMLMSQAVVRLMIPRRCGAIVTVASNAANTPRANMCAYASSKAAALMYTKCLGLEVAKHHIRCNTVSPGSTDTPMLAALNEDSDYHQAAIRGDADNFRLGIPLRRVAEVNDICNSVLFLLSPLARHITLHDLTVDGGATLGV